jgi:GTPase
MAFKSGFVAILGLPNAGKSTLLNRLVGRKLAIVSRKPQTTRNRILGIVNRENAQIVFIDTPGLHRPDSALGRQMLQEIAQAMEGIDVAALIVDATREFSPPDRYSLERIRPFRGSVFLLLNKIDRIPKERLLPLIDRWRRELEFAEIIPLSALTGENVDLLVEKLIERLSEGQPYFPSDQFTDQPERFLAAEIIREKAIAAAREELPYAIAVLVDSFEEDEKLIRIAATIYVEREGQRGILIGKRGARMKAIGTAARQELESLLGFKIFLSLYVKVLPNWRDKPALVRQLDWRRQLDELGGEH